MRITSRIACVCVVGLLFAFAAEPVEAARGAQRSRQSSRRAPHRSHRSGYNNNAAAAAAAAARAAYNARLAAAQQAADAAAAARAQVARAESALEARWTALRLAFAGSGDYLKAQAALRDAHAALESARQPLLAALDANPHYRAARQRKSEIQEQLQTARTGGDAGSVAALATAAMEQGTAMTAMEAERVNADQAVRTARARLVEAQSRVDTLGRRFETTVSTDPQRQAARRAVDDARAKRATADAVYASRNAALENSRAPSAARIRVGVSSRSRNHPVHRAARR